MKLLLLTALLVSSQCQAWQQTPSLPIQNCQHQAPYGFPHSTKAGVGICRTGYVSLNDTAAKIPVWTSYVLTPQNALGCGERPNAFAADASLLPDQRAEPSDYARTGYDLGHVVPFGDQAWDPQVGLESFLLTNIAPQLPNLNRGSWKQLESSIRGWAFQRNHAFLVYIGGFYDVSDKTIGANKVVVPHAFFKIVIDTTTNEVAGFIFPHSASVSNDLIKLRAPVAQIEQAAGIKFAYPANPIELQPDQLWPVDLGALIKSKQNLCKGK